MTRGQIFVDHLVTGAEAAYSTFLGHFTRGHEAGEWVSYPPMPDRHEEWNIRLRYLYAVVLRGGELVKGVPIGFYHIPTQNSTGYLQRTVQGWTQRPSWQGSLFVPYGFGIELRAGAVLANDQVGVFALYDKGER